LLAASAIIPMTINTRSMRNRILADRLAWVGFVSMGFLSSLFVATMLRDVFLATAHAALSAQQVGALALPSARWTLGLTGCTTLIGFLIARRPRLVEIDIPIPNLPPALAGFSIAQISDLHVGPTIKRDFVERIVERVNRLGADIVAITGDVVDGSVRDLRQHTSPLALLEARHGVFCVTGNHEYYSGERDWTAEFRRLGLTVLKNQHVILRHGGAPLLLAGVTDFSAQHFDAAQRSDPAAAMAGAEAHLGPRILLAHQPSSAAAAAAAGYDLQLSGHTHGGQFWPWNLLVPYFQPYTAGLNNLNDLKIYVSRGTGYWGPPNRFIVPAEITRIRLVAA
jgi:predicted MPP superfamily phosphohydrolase